jgi:hypothetical protein
VLRQHQSTRQERRRPHWRKPRPLQRPRIESRLRHVREPHGTIRPGHRPPNQTPLPRLTRAVRTNRRRLDQQPRRLRRDQDYPHFLHYLEQLLKGIVMSRSLCVCRSINRKYAVIS